MRGDMAASISLLEFHLDNSETRVNELPVYCPRSSLPISPAAAGVAVCFRYHSVPALAEAKSGSSSILAGVAISWYSNFVV